MDSANNDEQEILQQEFEERERDRKRAKILNDRAYEGCDLVGSCMKEELQKMCEENVKFRLLIEHQGIPLHLYYSSNDEICVAVDNSFVVQMEKVPEDEREQKIQETTDAIKKLNLRFGELCKDSIIHRQVPIRVPANEPDTFTFLRAMYNHFLCCQLMLRSDIRNKYGPFCYPTLKDGKYDDVETLRQVRSVVELDKYASNEHINLRAIVDAIHKVCSENETRVWFFFLSRRFCARLEKGKIVLQGLQMPVECWFAEFEIDPKPADVSEVVNVETISDDWTKMTPELVAQMFRLKYTRNLFERFREVNNGSFKKPYRKPTSSSTT